MTARTIRTASTASRLNKLARSWAPVALLVAASALPAVAGAHPGSPADHLGNAHGFEAGFLHPFTGLDHLGAMLAVGVWSAGSVRRLWAAPLAFMLCLVLGALATARGLAVPDIEPMIAFSLLGLGLLLASSASLRPGVAAALVGVFALFHGAAHGVELGTGQALMGMALATFTLQGCGIAIGLALRQQNPWWTRGAGIALALFGVSMLAT